MSLLLADLGQGLNSNSVGNFRNTKQTHRSKDTKLPVESEVKIERLQQKTSNKGLEHLNKVELLRKGFQEFKISGAIQQ
jgi:hypothetical protein